jgi:hypothetical protein
MTQDTRKVTFWISKFWIADFGFILIQSEIRNRKSEIATAISFSEKYREGIR